MLCLTSTTLTWAGLMLPFADVALAGPRHYQAFEHYDLGKPRPSRFKESHRP